MPAAPFTHAIVVSLQNYLLAWAAECNYFTGFAARMAQGECHFCMQGRIGDFVVEQPMVIGHESAGYGNADLGLICMLSLPEITWRPNLKAPAA